MYMYIKEYTTLTFHSLPEFLFPNEYLIISGLREVQVYCSFRSYSLDQNINNHFILNFTEVLTVACKNRPK